MVTSGDVRFLGIDGDKNPRCVLFEVEVDLKREPRTKRHFMLPGEVPFSAEICCQNCKHVYSREGKLKDSFLLQALPFEAYSITEQHAENCDSDSSSGTGSVFFDLVVTDECYKAFNRYNEYPDEEADEESGEDGDEEGDYEDDDDDEDGGYGEGPGQAEEDLDADMLLTGSDDVGPILYADMLRNARDLDADMLLTGSDDVGPILDADTSRRPRGGEAFGEASAVA